jgi:hypothetical protein
MENKIQFFDIIFLGLAQNCEKFLPKFFNTIDKLSKNKQIKVFIGENGSSDLTFDVIQKKIVFSDVYQFVDTTFIEKFNDRIKRLALARQSLKDNILKLNIKSKYVCVIDLDDVINDIFHEKLLNNLTNKLETNRDKYFGVSLSSKPYYYDILNFESEEFPNTNIIKVSNLIKIEKNLFIMFNNLLLRMEILNAYQDLMAYAYIHMKNILNLIISKTL